MEITAAIIKQLREATHAGIMDCKKALIQSNGDFAAAEKILKEMGLAAVAKRVDRSTNEGRITIVTEGSKTCMVEITCETDFVAKNATFAKLGVDVAKKILSEGYTEVNDVLVDMVNGLIATINENMKLKKFVVVDTAANEYVSTYVHGDGAIGVITKFKAEDSAIFASEAFKDFAFKTALHVCAQNPTFMDAKVVPADFEKEQVEIFTKQVESIDKPEKVKAGIVQGKLKKLYSEICLYQQVFDFDNPDGLTTEALYAKFNKENNCKVTIDSYIRYRKGSND